MPEYTPKGISYPLASDRIKDASATAKLAADMKSLATTTDAAISDEGIRAEGAANEYTDAAAWIKTTTLVSGADIYAIVPGAYSPISPQAALAMGLPTQNYGALLKYEWDNAGVMQWIPSTSRGNEVWQKAKVGGSWQSWGRIDRAVQVLLSDADLGALSDGLYRPISPQAAVSMGLPSSNVGPLSQFSDPSGNVQQTWTPISSDPRIYIRSKVGAIWAEWAMLTPGGDKGGSVEREMRVARADARRGGVYGTSGCAALSLVFDHGTSNFVSKVLPILREFGVPAVLGLNSQMYNPAYQFASSDNQTTFAQLQTMAINNGVSIWNHGRLHNAGGAPEIVGGREELEASLPQIPVENWLHTGTYGDFAAGSTFAKYWEHEMGAVIMNSHAYLTGDIQEPVKPLNGTIKPGYDGQWIDTGGSALTIAKSMIADAQKVVGGVMIRQHPMYLDTAGYMTTAELREFILWAAAERDAGRLLILTADLMNLADSGRNDRRNLLDGTGGTGNQTRTVSLSRNALALGSVNELHATVKLTTAGSVKLTATATGLTATRTITVPANTWVDVRTFFTIPLTATGDLTVTTSLATGSGLTVNQINVYPG